MCDDIFAKIAYGKAQAELTPTLDGQGKRREEKRKEEEEKGGLSFARAGLSSYLYRLCITCVNLSMLGVVSPYHSSSLEANIRVRSALSTRQLKSLA
jgi:hypothetical protein